MINYTLLIARLLRERKFLPSGAVDIADFISLNAQVNMGFQIWHVIITLLISQQCTVMPHWILEPIQIQEYDAFTTTESDDSDNFIWKLFTQQLQSVKDSIQKIKQKITQASEYAKESIARRYNRYADMPNVYNFMGVFKVPTFNATHFPPHMLQKKMWLLLDLKEKRRVKNLTTT